MKPFNLDEYLKNPDRKVVTRDGKAVKIHCTNYNSNFPIIAEIEGAHSSDSFNKEGKFYQIPDSENDLFFAPEKHEGWVNVYRDMRDSWEYCGRIYDSEEEAKVRANNPLATIKIKWEE